jgi:hypothetical protein
MKIITISTLALFGIMACGKSENSDASGKENEQINEQSIFADTVKPSKDILIDFEKHSLNALPRGWSQSFTGSGNTDWKVINDNGDKVLAQLYSNNPSSHFNIIINDSIRAKDMTLSVKLKGVKGDIDQGGGLVWRFIDKENYYVVRANPLENNAVLYKVQEGKRTDLPLIGKGRTYGTDVPAMGNTWHDLKLIVKGNIFTVYLDEKELFKVKDETFKNAGKVGFWSKADAVSYFNDFKAEVFE